MKKYFFSLPVWVLVFLNIFPLIFIPYLVVENAPEVFLPKSQPSVILEDELREVFPESDVLVILLKSPDLYSDAFLKSIESAAQAIVADEKVERVINVTEMEHISGTEDGFEVESLLGANKRKMIVDPLKRYTYAYNDITARDLLVSSDPEFMALVVRPVKVETTAARIEIYNHVIAVMQASDLWTHVAGIGGAIPREIEQYKSMLSDNMMFVPGTMIIGLSLIWFLFRRLMAVVIAGLVTGAVVNSTMLFFVVFDTPYTMISSMIPPLLAALTTALLVHFYNSLRTASAYSYESDNRVAYALKEIKKPAVFTALTTMLGLLSLGMSPIPPINVFGYIAAAGVFISMLLVLYVVAPIFSVFDKKSWCCTTQKKGFLDVVLQKAVHIAIRKAGWVITIICIGLVIGSGYIFKVNAETNMMKYFSDDHPLTLSTHLIEDKLSGVMSLDVVFYGDGRDSLKKIANLKQIENFQQWVSKLPQVDKVNSLVDTIKQMHLSFHLNDKQYDKLPDNDALISQYFFIYDGKDIYELVNREFDQTRVTLSLNEHNSGKIRDFLAQLDTYLQSHIKGIKWDIGGEARLFAEQDRLLISGQVYSLFIAIILIFAMMLLSWRNTGQAVLTMLPNLSPIIGIFILMGIFNVYLDMATAMISSVAIGIAVDDTIHLFHGYRKRVKQGSGVIHSLLHSYYKSGRAVMVTTVILCSQFLLLTFSEFSPTVHFGLLTATGMIMALLFDLFLLPALIVVLYYKKPK